MESDDFDYGMIDELEDGCWMRDAGRWKLGMGRWMLEIWNVGFGLRQR